MSLFRSQEMALCQLFLQPEAAYACVSELGELGLVQFRDLSPNVSAFQRKFVSEVRRCEEMERKLRYVEKEMKKDGIKITESGENPKAPFPREMVDLEAAFEKLETELREVNTNAEALQRNYLELSELREVLKKTQTFFTVHEEDHIYQSLVDDTQHSLATAEAPTAQSSVMQLGFVAGVINRERMAAFERILWFACRGNVFLKTEEIAQPLQDPHSSATGTYVLEPVTSLLQSPLHVYHPKRLKQAVEEISKKEVEKDSVKDSEPPKKQIDESPERTDSREDILKTAAEVLFMQKMVQSKQKKTGKTTSGQQSPTGDGR